jgi:hypothetical protein
MIGAHWMVAGHSGWVLLVFAAAAIAALYLAVRYWGLSRRIADTARARVRSAPHGYVELYGRAEFATDAKCPVAPLTGRTCVWWSYRIARNSGRRRAWETLDSGTSDAAFMLRDDTGACLVDPRDALVKPSERQVWYGPESWPSAPYSTGSGLFGDRYQYVEQRIYENDGVCVLGEFATVGGIADGIADVEVSALLHDWKLDQAGLLKRFDQDGDGKLSVAEWEHARAAARSEVLSRQTQTPVVKQIAKPSDGRPYVLAARDPAHLAQSYRWQAAAGLAGFFLAVLALTRILMGP